MNARQQLAHDLGSRIPGCAVGSDFGHGCLQIKEKIFAFTRSDESAALKLPEARVAQLIASGGEMHLLQMGKRTMREWLVVPNAIAPENLKLLREAMAYVASLPPEKKRAKKKSVKQPASKTPAKTFAKKSAAKKATATKTASRVAKKK